MDRILCPSNTPRSTLFVSSMYSHVSEYGIEGADCMDSLTSKCQHPLWRQDNHTSLTHLWFFRFLFNAAVVLFILPGGNTNKWPQIGTYGRPRKTNLPGLATWMNGFIRVSVTYGALITQWQLHHWISPPQLGNSCSHGAPCRIGSSGALKSPHQEYLVVI